ncbi:IS91 family transposase [Natronoflexus pectinivorans]|uniref:Transposase-like zinc-binding protein n=1 Tax=Natronoflexus pectinivorans TaxID=682526 RepID=A0A4R2GJ08_9BACT|nr:transposase-like zinc-binding protein [Natronoflexus pectinivorans]
MEKRCKNKHELAHIVRQFGKSLLQSGELSPKQIKVLYNIVQCRTATLGGHEQVCKDCGVIHYSYNSCRDRHCPKCQGTKQALWVEKLIKSTLAVKHYHIIFTVPHELNQIYLWDRRLYCNILFRAASRTLHSFGYTHYGCETGVVAVLHTWGQNLSLHPHLHCIVPAAGYSLSGKWRHIGKYENYLYPVHQLSAAFTVKFLDSRKRELRKLSAMDGFKVCIEKAHQKKWVVYCESSLAGADHVIRYLGQYTHRIAISNQRILDVNSTHVTFVAKDYRDRAQKKPVPLTGEEFLRRFSLHIMPDGFVRIRRFGIYHHSTKLHLDLQFVPDEKPDIEQMVADQKDETASERILRLTGFDVTKCPHCKEGRLIVIRILPRIRSPSGHLPSMLFAKLQ